ncbi:hypothetical protein B0T20DRAFT_407570 [Sordaria brevicollis]|uniref:Uncharacterized protein n=1 Tax=Sordaria brevicollis TaxID=83679 RepID=A0AAE0PHL9_SORBR|nr:hypothetical protein B0T20DRAFT_407570 [Sordaria brevicollis]
MRYVPRAVGIRCPACQQISHISVASSVFSNSCTFSSVTVISARISKPFPFSHYSAKITMVNIWGQLLEAGSVISLILFPRRMSLTVVIMKPLTDTFSR